MLVGSPVMRTGVAACSVHGFHRGKLVAVKGCGNRKAAGCARCILQHRRVIVTHMDFPGGTRVEVGSQYRFLAQRA